MNINKIKTTGNAPLLICCGRHAIALYFHDNKLSIVDHDPIDSEYSKRDVEKLTDYLFRRLNENNDKIAISIESFDDTDFVIPEENDFSFRDSLNFSQIDMAFFIDDSETVKKYFTHLKNQNTQLSDNSLKNTCGLWLINYIVKYNANNCLSSYLDGLLDLKINKKINNTFFIDALRGETTTGSTLYFSMEKNLTEPVQTYLRILYKWYREEKISKEEYTNLINSPNNNGLTPLAAAMVNKNYLTACIFLIETKGLADRINLRVGTDFSEHIKTDETMQKAILALLVSGYPINLDSVNQIAANDKLKNALGAGFDYISENYLDKSKTDIFYSSLIYKYKTINFVKKMMDDCKYDTNIVEKSVNDWVNGTNFFEMPSSGNKTSRKHFASKAGFHVNSEKTKNPISIMFNLFNRPYKSNDVQPYKF